MDSSTFDQTVLFVILGVALVLFISGPVRYDGVALLALLAVTLTGVVPASEAFAGFGHPAVITVAAVLVISYGLQQAGAIELIARPLGRLGNSVTLNILAMTALVALLSGFMNNIGALALMMPVAIRRAEAVGFPVSSALMPLAFASLLGGLTTLIGTPPNLIISGFREESTGTPFAMFDFSLAGVVIATAGVLFIGTLGWRFAPQRTAAADAATLFETDRYLSELRVPAGSRAVGKMVRDIEAIGDSPSLVVGIFRAERYIAAPSPFETIAEDDLVTIEAEPDSLGDVMERLGLELTGATGLPTLPTDELELIEAVVLPASPLAANTAHDFDLRNRFGINLLAVARTETRVPGRLSQVVLKPGDIVLLQGPARAWREALRLLALAPLRTAPELPEKAGRHVLLGLAIFAAAVGAIAFGWIPAQVALAAAALAMILVRIIRPIEAYNAIDWPIIVLLGAMLPVGTAFETSGAAARVSELIVSASTIAPDAATVLLLMLAAMLLSNILNNAATAVLMAPIGLGLATELGVSAEPLLMAIAVGASSPFLTPIGHQSNTLVLRPGGYKFGDYWKMGLPLQLIVLAVGVPAILLAWPL